MLLSLADVFNWDPLITTLILFYFPSFLFIVILDAATSTTRRRFWVGIIIGILVMMAILLLLHLKLLPVTERHFFVGSVKWSNIGILQERLNILIVFFTKNLIIRIRNPDQCVLLFSRWEVNQLSEAEENIEEEKDDN